MTFADGNEVLELSAGVDACVLDLLDSWPRTAIDKSVLAQIEEGAECSMVGGGRVFRQAGVLCCPVPGAVCNDVGVSTNDVMIDESVGTDVDGEITTSGRSDGVQAFSRCEGKPACKYH